MRYLGINHIAYEGAAIYYFDDLSSVLDWIAPFDNNDDIEIYEVTRYVSGSEIAEMQEKRKQFEQEIREQAIAKLTASERKALGV